ncbi:MAG: MBL fold metallo-hydrolase [Desulfobacteraceae bacterium]
MLLLLAAAGILLVIAAFACTTGQKSDFSEKVWMNRVSDTDINDLYAPHFQGGGFFNPWLKMADKSFLSVLGWKLFSRTEYSDKEKHFQPRVIPDTAERLSGTTGDFILWIGHNTFLVRIGSEYWLTDPIFTKRALLPARVTPPAISLRDLNISGENLNIVISHNHYDHLDRSSMEQLPAKASVYVPEGLGTYVGKMNKPVVLEMDWWDEKQTGPDSRIVCLPAQHWSMRIGQGRNRTLWASWLLITPEATLYFGGDSGYFKGFREFGRKYQSIDYAFLATTAYHPRWFMHYQHMNIPEAVRAFEELGASYFIPTQWGTFPLGSEPAGFPGLDLKRYIRDNQLDPSRFSIMDIGEILPVRQ